MGCKLTQNIKHSCDYNPGGIAEIYLLDVSDFVAYVFKEDGLYDTCHVEKLIRSGKFVELDVVSESVFTEQYSGGVFKQELQTFIRSVGGHKTAQLLLSTANKYVVMYKTHDGKTFCFGHDGGASLSFGQQSGQVGEGSGYEITISKSSLYPQLEVDAVEWASMLFSYENGLSMFTASGLYVEEE